MVFVSVICVCWRLGKNVGVRSNVVSNGKYYICFFVYLVINLFK